MYALCIQIRLHGSARKCGSFRVFIHASKLSYIPGATLLLAEISHLLRIFTAFSTIFLDGRAQETRVLLCQLFFVEPSTMKELQTWPKGTGVWTELVRRHGLAILIRSPLLLAIILVSVNNLNEYFLER